MDPDTALENLLTGFMLFDHVEALSGWLAREGFAPAERTLPELSSCAVFIREHVARHYPDTDCTTIHVRADRSGLWTAPPEGQWISLGVWPELLRMAEAADDSE